MSKIVKRAGSPIAGGSGSEAKKQSREKVEFSENVWLDVLKLLKCPKWSKMRLVSRQLNGVVQRNISRLPLAIIDIADIRLKERKRTEVKLIVLDSTILPDEKDQWFQDRYFALDLPEDIQMNNVILGFEPKKYSCADLCILGPAQEEELTPYEKRRPWFCERGLQFKAEVFFYAEFSPHRNKYSWASMEFFLKLLYDQSTYVKDLSMYSLDKKLNEILFPNVDKRRIRCGTFNLHVTDNTSVEKLCESVTWLEQNIQAENIELPSSILYDNDHICSALAKFAMGSSWIIDNAVANYALGVSWISANQMAKLGRVNDIGRSFKTLIKKYGFDGPVQLRVEFVREPEKRDPKVTFYWQLCYGHFIRGTLEAYE